jgi:hypothetical protein
MATQIPTMTEAQAAIKRLRRHPLMDRGPRIVDVAVSGMAATGVSSLERFSVTRSPGVVFDA